MIDEGAAVAVTLFERAVKNAKARAWWQGRPIEHDEAVAQVLAEVAGEWRRIESRAFPPGKVFR
ncbi:hypothetical protein I5G67_gp075 [Mycobacterium phage Aminay]|uniref:Uncharacterized protein n=1 Tax=Mycobacterium phage Aminay TaxID=2250291 RepID=A0A345KV59_9CAUD|nr:hypothetical protein I5G67_gp075 [Mycobacterium phage Aminay]AXH46911.1 hypothetical protein SEA_AMINAY_75 [Mycobacterium phage Aminay]